MQVSMPKTLSVLLGIWLCWVTLHVYALKGYGFPMPYLLYDSLVSNILLTLNCLALGNIIRYYQPSGTSVWKLAVWCLVVTGAWLMVLSLLYKVFLSGEPFYAKHFYPTLPVRFAIGFLVLGCTILMVWVWEYANLNAKEAERQANARTAWREAELTGLTSQLQPHFLFNSLNSINALIGNRPEDARIMTQQLSDFLRGTLHKDQMKPVKLGEELRQIELYLNIEKVRFGHRLHTVIDADESLREWLMPAFILQPVIENAIKYGLYDTTGTVTISLKAEGTNQQLRLEISNPYDPEAAPVRGGTGFGLQSIKRRLYLLYGRMDLLITHSDGRTFQTIIIIPQKSNV